MKELLSQLPEDVIGSRLNKEDSGRTPFLLHSIYREGVSPGANNEESLCVVSDAVSFEVSIAMKIYIVIWVRTLCSLMG
jgi:hypothetical protein